MSTLEIKNTRTMRGRGIVALLLSAALLAAAGQAPSLASGPELRLACQGTSCGG
jgi:hypothetical protein